MRRYLLGELSDTDEESFELRLLTDLAFGEEFDTVVDEVTDQYIQNELQDDERQRVEQYFLSTTERQQKLEFASELLRRAKAERGSDIPVPQVVETPPGLWEKIRVFLAQQSFAHLAATVAGLVLVASVGFYLLRPGSYTSLDLAISTANRADSTTHARVKLPGAGVHLNLAIPESAKGASDYRVKFINADEVEKDLTIEEQNDRTIKVTVPASLLTRRTNVIQLWKVKSDGSVERVQGSYYFDVE